ncbi:MAG TPA: hypothetical protein VH724_21185 [Candidatus Angelobacter sp.]|jgi:hypothetical protein|nr:hypothetical protein [Candidatus Angelobacter sp.]
MKTLDRVLAWTLLAFGSLHTVASVFLMLKRLSLDSAWFFGGGLAVIFAALLNLVRAYGPPDKLVLRAGVLANLLLLVLVVILMWLLRHDLTQNPQVIVLIVVAVAELLLSVKQWFR